ncbi:hypothetical protein BAE44_0006949 [Dichanthelium oligosanthes]|uniref:TF-B3 domain-containing protein n=1 Tax=Dichanthelium oligosanthes TaxID=888268 RepID=A0A1E5W3P1_9POAL|nr:hypothetical protein BAE44_0006949 [Dichanthelium oligosanthes]
MGNEKMRSHVVADEDFRSCMGNEKMRFHVVADEDCRSCMRIPQEAGCLFRKINYETIKLNALSGCLYDIGVSKEMGEIVLRSGWDIFATAHNLEENDSLVFKFCGTSSFKVQIYSSHGGSQKISSCVSPLPEILEAVLPRNEVPYPGHAHKAADLDYFTLGGSRLTKAQDKKVLEMAHTIRSQIPLYVAVMKKTNVDVKGCYIRIPSILLKDAIDEVFKATVKLEAPDSNIYSISAAQQSDNEIVLQSGWDAFVVAHRVQEGDLIIFRYKGNSRLEVFILDRNGGQKTSSSFGIGYVPNTQEMSDDSVQVIDPPHKTVDIIDLSSSNSSDDDNTVAAYNAKSASPQKRQLDHCAKNRRMDSTSSPSIKSHHEHETHEDLQASMVDGVKQSPLYSNNSEGPSLPPYIISRNITLSRAQEKMVLEKVQAIGSKFPIFVSVMNKTSTGEKGFLMRFATEYARRCLPSATQDLTLRLEGCRSKQWHTVLHVQGGQSRARNEARIAVGWAEFVTDNRLWLGDICMFEMVKITRRLKMIVHLIRQSSVHV